MAGTQVQRRRGTTAEHSSFTGAVGEITVDTTKKTAVVHDGATAGGIPLAKESALASYQPLDALLTGLAADTTMLGGFRNKLINGGMVVSQRGTVTLSNAVWAYGACDRWENYVSATTVTANVTQAAAAGSSYGWQNQINITSTTGTTSIGFRQKIEAANSNCLNSKTVTFRCKLYQNTGSTQTASIQLYKANTKDNFSAITLIGGENVSVADNTVVTATINVVIGASDASNGIQVNIAYTGMSALTSKIFTIFDAQLEEGSVATPFETRNIQQELALCQRYYYRIKPGVNNGQMGLAQCYTTTTGGAIVKFPVTMRTAPSALEQSGTAGDYGVYSAAGAQILLSAAPTYASVATTVAGAAVNFTVASGLVAGNVTQIHTTGANGYLGWSAEL